MPITALKRHGNGRDQQRQLDGRQRIGLAEAVEEDARALAEAFDEDDDQRQEEEGRQEQQRDADEQSP